MSSPQQSSDRTPSSQRSTPSRNLSNGIKRVNGYHRQHRDSLNDSPSRQRLEEEFSRMLINNNCALNRSLDEQTAAQQKLHVEALDRSLAKHEQVRESAREWVELEIERERRRREYEERKALEKARREIEEQKQRRQLEDQRAKEEERKRQEKLQREQDEAKRREDAQKQREQEENAKREKQQREKADQRARQAAEAKDRAEQAEKERKQPAQQPSAPQSQLNGGTLFGSTSSTSALPTAPTQPSHVPSSLPQGLVSSPEERLATHNKYLDLHKRLKQMRVNVFEEAKKVPGFKNKLSDWRRSIQKCCGQLSKGTSEEVKANNKRAMLEIMNQLDAAAQVSTPTIDITQYLVQNNQPPGANTQGPAALLFLLNHFSKTIIRQLISESAVDAKSADAIGILAVTVFARPQYLFNGQSLIDLLWAGYHKHCPVLFGITGSEKTTQGRAKLGWPVDKSSNSFVREQAHYDRMSGLSAGFAAITLRDFSKSKNANPAPNRIFWESLARILNTPKQDVQPTHFVVLKAMINESVPRIIRTFGDAGLAVLRQALIYFPQEKGPQDENGRKLPAVTAVEAMPMVLQLSGTWLGEGSRRQAHGHPSPSSRFSSGFSPLARSAMSSNASADINGYFAQMGSASRAPASQSGVSHAHFTPINGTQGGFNPPTAPAAMRAGNLGQGGMQGGQHSTMATNDVQRRRVGGQGLIRTAGLPDGWYR